MSLHFVFGASGAGKSYYIYQKIIRESIQNPKKQYLVLVPEQFTNADTERTGPMASKKRNFKY